MFENRHKPNILFAAIAAGIVICMIILNISPASQDMGHIEHDATVTETEDPAKPVVHLYFADRNNSFLKAEERDFQSNNPTEFGKAIVEALIEGPRSGLMRTIPQGSTLKAFYITRDGTAYVDMAGGVKDAYSGGVKSELFAIYSMVDSLTLNIPEIDSVKFLINGKESMTLNGHVDLRFPFKANMLLIR
ncbi:MAG: GerMN domain-containing protein [Desulfobacterales bacterium]